MKKLLTLLILFSFANADLIPPNQKGIRKTVILTNAPDFSSISIFVCARVITKGGALECSILDRYNATISKGYKFNSGPYLFAIKKSTISKYGGINKFMQKPIKEALAYLISKKGLSSNIGSSYTYYVNMSSKEKDSTDKFKIVSVKGNKLELVKLQ